MSSMIQTELTGKEVVSEFEKLLDLAEELKEQCEKTEAQINRQSIFSLVNLGVIASIFIGIIIDADHFQKRGDSLLYSSHIFLVVLGVVVSIVNAYVFYRTRKHIKKLQQSLSIDRKAVREVVGLLREVEGVESKSPLERAYFRIKLSRFDI